MKKNYFLLVLFVSNVLCAYPISPNTLKKLIEDSQTIIVAEVTLVEIGRNEIIENRDSVEFINEMSKAHLNVKSILKGNVKNEITVLFDGFITCPTPAHYKEGTNVIAFLDKKPLEKTYSTHARNYGLKTLNEEGLAVYLQRIKEFQQILKIEDIEVQRKETIEWLVKCAENKYTRFEGLYDLNPESEFMSYFDRNTSTFTNKFTINENQKQRLRNTLFALNEIDYEDFSLIDLVKTENDTELINFLVNQLKQYSYDKLNLEQMYYIESFMQYLSKLTKNEDLKVIYDKYHDNSLDFNKNNVYLLKLIHEFLIELDNV